ncbi:DUF11 domain-containing protein [Paracoccus sp. DK398]|nr:DUF11 domain-containing protein [Paracoccus shanxieyensis]
MRQLQYLFQSFARVIFVAVLYAAVASIFTAHAVNAQDIVSYTNRTAFDNDLPAINSVQTLENFSSVSDSNMSGVGDTFNGFSVRRTPAGTNRGSAFGYSRYCTLLSAPSTNATTEGCLDYNNQSPSRPGMVLSVAGSSGTNSNPIPPINYGPGTVVFTFSNKPYAFFFDFVDWNDIAVRSEFVFQLSNGTSRLVTGPIHSWNAPPDFYGAVVGRSLREQGVYIQSVVWRGVPSYPEGEMIGIWEVGTYSAVSAIELQKEFGTAVLNSDGSYDLPVTLTVTNTGDLNITALSGLQLEDFLSGPSGFGTSFQGIVSPPTAMVLDDGAGIAPVAPNINPLFDGTAANSDLLDGSSGQLGTGDRLIVSFVARAFVDPSSGPVTLSNTANVSAVDVYTSGQPNLSDQSTDTVTLGLPAASLVVRKNAASVPSPAAEGQTVTYRYEVENTGDVDLANISLNDAHAGANTLGPLTVVSGTPTLLSPGGTLVFQADYALAQADIDGNNLSNTVTATGSDPYGNAVTDTDSVTLQLAAPGLSIAKFADTASVSGLQRIGYTITVSNSGNTSFAGADLVVSDALSTSSGSVALSPVLESPNAGDSDADGALDPGETWRYTAFYDVTQADLDAGTDLVNVARVAVPTGPNPLPATDSPDVPVTVAAAPGLSIAKSADTASVSGLQRIGYTITVSNSGNTSFAGADLVVSDALSTSSGSVALSPVLESPNAGDSDADGALDPGETWRYTAFYDVTQADLDAGTDLVNVARVAVPTGPNPLPATDSPDVPVTVAAAPAVLTLEKLVGVQTAMIGDTVPYTIRVGNAAGTASATIRITDILPPGFHYRSGSARLDGVDVTPAIHGRRLIVEPVLVRGGQSRVLTLDLLVGGSVRPGDHTNRARITDPATGADLAPEAQAVVRVLADAVMQCATVLGRVFDDRDQNGHMSPKATERGLPDIRLVAPNGLAISTDAHGRFNVPCAALPQGIGSNFMLKLDERTLPAGYRLTTENPRVVRLTPGMITRLDFGATLARLVRIDLSANAFAMAQDRETMRPELDAGLVTMVDRIRDRPTMLRISYVLAKAEPRNGAEQRLKLVERAVRELWRRSGTYKLNIETVIERAGVAQ